MPETANHVEVIFLEALERLADERPAFLDERCRGDQNLKRQVTELLLAHEQTSSFFVDRKPVWQATAETMEVAERVGQKIGPYTLREKIGEGGMGVVYVAEQERPIRRKVALKVIKPGMDSKTVLARFEAEQQALAIMSHRNIAKVLDAGLADSGRPYFVMELVSGIPITEYCDEKRLNVTERLELFVSVCQAIQHAHQKGIIHRDFKPSNVLVTEEDGQSVPKIIDFGVAKALSQRLTDRTLYTNFQAFLGTPMYASPEQASLSNVDVDTRSDVYSLGVLLYELVTGSTPYDKQQMQKAAYEEMCRIIREQEAVKPSVRLSTMDDTATEVSKRRRSDPTRLIQSVRGDLDWIVMKALEKDRSRRYEGASSLAADIRRLLNNETIEARPPSMVYQLRKSIYKNRVVLGVACALCLAVTGGLSVGLIKSWASNQRLIATKSDLEAAKSEAEQEKSKLRRLLDKNEQWFTDRALLEAMNGRVDEAKALAAQLAAISTELGTTPTAVANSRFIEGIALFFGGSEQLANQKLNEALNQSPDSFEINAMYALCTKIVEGDIKYEATMNKLDSLPPSNDPFAKLFRGFAELYRDPLAAAAIVEGAVAESPSTIGHAIRSGIYGHLTLHTGDSHYMKDSWYSSEMATDESPYNAFVMLTRMFALQNQIIVAGKANDPVAEELYRQQAKEMVAEMAKRHPKYFLGRLLRAAHFLQVNERSKAIEELLSLAKEGNWLVSLAPAVFETEHADAAKLLFETLTEAQPNSYVAMAYLKAADNLEEAESYCWKELDNFPCQNSALHAANALLFLGKVDSAKRLARHALERIGQMKRPYSQGIERLKFILHEDVSQLRSALSTSRMADSTEQAIAYQQGMFALARGEIETARSKFSTSKDLEPFPDSDNHYWAIRFLEFWESDPDWLPPGPRSGERGAELDEK